eukprot:TRINITY_DN7089_c0_g1_i1.p1 TRINITY_DN7089_c0_g1~~TRINITY_DN7089_c0_g1_i1.p1  ORF type:complete len:608 (-),score=224.49 TRINITY_DN7089_c0_g1_i1:39-1862(-)
MEYADSSNGNNAFQSLYLRQSGAPLLSGSSDSSLSDLPIHPGFTLESSLEMNQDAFSTPSFNSPLDISFQHFNGFPNSFNRNDEIHLDDMDKSRGRRNFLSSSQNIQVENAIEMKENNLNNNNYNNNNAYRHNQFPMLGGTWSPHSDDSSSGTTSGTEPFESGSSPWSPDSTPPFSIPLDASKVASLSEAKLEVILMHKPRGSQGIWQPVPPGAGLRVTKGKGKRLKIQIKSNIEFDKSRVDILMLDLMTTVQTTEGFAVEQMFEIDSPYMTELELKLSRYYKRCQFIVSVKTALGPIKSKTIEFCSHNNGKQTKSDALPTPSIPSFSSISEQHLATGIADVENSTSYSEKKRKNEVSGEEERISVINGNLEVNGNVRAQAFMQFSDQRLKTNITDLVGALEIMMKLQGKSYQWKNEYFDNAVGPNRVIGLIAQEVQRVLPEVVHTDPISGILSVSYAEIIPVIIEGFKQHRLDSINERQDVHGQLEQLKKQLEAVEQESKVQKSRMYQHLYASKQRILNPHEQFAAKLSTFVRILLISFGILGLCASLVLFVRFKRHPPVGSIVCLLLMGVGFNLIAIFSYFVQRNRRKRSEKNMEETVSFIPNHV